MAGRARPWSHRRQRRCRLPRQHPEGWIDCQHGGGLSLLRCRGDGRKCTKVKPQDDPQLSEAGLSVAGCLGDRRIVGKEAVDGRVGWVKSTVACPCRRDKPGAPSHQACTGPLRQHQSAPRSRRGSPRTGGQARRIGARSGSSCNRRGRPLIRASALDGLGMLHRLAGRGNGQHADRKRPVALHRIIRQRRLAVRGDIGGRGVCGPARIMKRDTRKGRIGTLSLK